MNNKTLLASILIFAMGVGLFVLYNRAEKADAGFIVRTIDILGSSTTSPQNFDASATTTTSIFAINRDIDLIDFDIYPEFASSNAHIIVHIQKSSQDNCARSTGVDQWVDALATKSTAANITTLDSGTSTVKWSPPENLGGLGFAKVFQLTNVNAFCIQLEVNASSSNVYIQATLKSNL